MADKYPAPWRIKCPSCKRRGCDKLLPSINAIVTQGKAGNAADGYTGKKEGDNDEKQKEST